MFSSTQLTRYLNWCHISVVVGVLLINMAENSHEFAYSDLPLITISVLGVALNVLLLVAFLKDPLKCFRNSGTYLVMNLAVSDCLTCLVAPFFLFCGAVIPGWHWIFEFLVMWFGTASFVSIASISIDRFLLVAYPIKHHILMRAKVIILWLAAIWIVSCARPLIRLFYDRKGNKRIAVYIFGVSMIITSAVIYAFTYWKMRKQAKNIALQNSREIRAQEIRLLKEKKFLNTILIIACVAFLCIVPFMVFSSINPNPSNLRGNILVIQIFTKIFLFFFYANFAVNPIIYVIRLPNYRKTFYLLYWRRAR